MPDEYSNREIDAMMDSVHGKLDLILEQTTKTNGTVIAVNRRVSCLESWRDRMTGGLAVLVALLLPVLVYVVQQWL